MAVNDELAPYVIKQVDGLLDCIKKDEQSATAKGAYGAVYKVSVRGFPCVAKRLHKLLLSPHVALVEESGKTPQEKFRKECIILSKLRHPNVVHFVGVHLGRNVSDVTLLMECVSSDLAHFLQVHKDIPLSIKLSALLDVSYGLLYLHTRDPPIIHRDLTARNVLVTFDGQAKIADLGVAKSFDRKLRSHTQTPGQLYYMPPEALRQDANYTQKIDIFSFGHLALYTIIQEEPKIFDIEHGNTTLVDLPLLNLQIVRQEESLKRVGEDHCIYPIMSQCLQDRANDRPTTEQLCVEMKELCAKRPKTPRDVHKLLLIQHKDGEGAISDEVDQLKRELTIAKQETSAAQGQRAVMEQGLMTAHEVCTVLQSELQQTKERKSSAESRVIVLQQFLQEAQEKRNELQQEVEDLKRKGKEQKSSIATLVEKLSISESQAQSNKEVEDLKRKCKEQKSSIATLVEKLSISESQAQSNKTDFDDERKDREKAHSLLADLKAKFEKKSSEWNARESSLVNQLEYAKHKNDQLTEQLSLSVKEGESLRKKLRKLQHPVTVSEDIVNKPQTRWKRAFTVLRYKGKRDDLPMFYDSKPPTDVCEETAFSDAKTSSPHDNESESPHSISIPSGNRTATLPLSISAPCYSDSMPYNIMSTSSDSKSQESNAIPQHKDSSTAMMRMDEDHSTTNHELDSSQPAVPQCQEPDWVPRSYIEKAQAMHDYIKKKDDELSFTSGTIVYVMKKHNDGWNEGIIAGVFPANYVKIVT